MKSIYLDYWQEVGTGGGCTALEYDGDGVYYWLTDASGCEVPKQWVEPGNGMALLGVYIPDADATIGFVFLVSSEEDVKAHLKNSALHWIGLWADELFNKDGFDDAQLELARLWREAGNEVELADTVWPR
jgi:hypothetical protein